jgi:hypothetical protein
LKTKIYPPIEGFTHQVLIDEIGNFVYQKFLDLGVDPKLAEETVYAMSALILKKFNENTVEHMIARYVQQPDAEGTDRNASIEGMANEYSCIVIDSATAGIFDSHLIPQVEKSDLVEVVNGAGDFLFKKIIGLKNTA